MNNLISQSLWLIKGKIETYLNMRSIMHIAYLHEVNLQNFNDMSKQMKYSLFDYSLMSLNLINSGEVKQLFI